MMNSAIEALYIFNSQNECILQHAYHARPPPPRPLLAAYLAHRPAPPPAVLHLPAHAPPTTLFTLRHANLLLACPATREAEPLAALTFLLRLVDALEDLLGAPLLAAKVVASYDVVAQVLGEVVDGGLVATTEGNALREVVSVSGWVDKLLEGVGMRGTSTPSSSSSSNLLRQQLGTRPQLAPSGPAIPWRRPNVRHTSNELYVDLVEQLHVTLAPSGRPLAAFAHGSVLFNAKISGVPDLLLNLTLPGGSKAMERALENPSFHPCVRLNRWKDRPGELSFVPPDGKFMLAGYTVDLLPSVGLAQSNNALRSLNLPVHLSVKTSLGPTGAEFEVRLQIAVLVSSSSSGSTTPNPSSLRASASASASGRSTPTFFPSSASSSGTASAPQLQNVLITVPLPPGVRNAADLRPSRGEAVFNAAHETFGRVVEWRVPTKDAGAAGTAVLRCSVVGDVKGGYEEEWEESDDEGEAEVGGGTTAAAVPSVKPATQGASMEYDEMLDGEQAAWSYQDESAEPTEPAPAPASLEAEGDGAETPAEGAVKKKKKKKKDKDKEELDENGKLKKKKKKKKKLLPDPVQVDNLGAAAASYQSPLPAGPSPSAAAAAAAAEERAAARAVAANKALMPSAALASFSVKGWLASGLRVESLTVDVRRSRGIGEGVKPVKGAKYLTVSRGGVETRVWR